MSSEDERDLPAMRQLRSELVAAAHRQAVDRKAARGWRWRVPPRGLVLAVIALVIAATAGAATLLSTGKPEPDRVVKSGRYRSATAQPLVPVVTAPDTRSGVYWGVATYESPVGATCAIAGQQRGDQLGISHGGVFHRYAPGTGGPCGDLRQQMFFDDVRYFGDPAPRTLVYGRARPGVAEIVMHLGRRTYVARTGRGGAFLFLFEGRETVAGMTLTGS